MFQLLKMEKYEGTLDWKHKSVQRSNIVSNLASDLINSDAKRRIIQKIRPKETKTILVISMATLPIVVVFSGVVDKKAEKNSISYGGLKQLKF